MSARTYQVDKSHSEATFQVRHLLTKVRGHFTDLDGTITLDEQNPAQSEVHVTIQAASIDTNEPSRDTHLRSPDFFSTEQFPTLSFKSVSVTPNGGNAFVVNGDLTIHGVTRSVRLETEFNGAATDPFGNSRVGFSATTEISRKDFGLTWNAALETGGVLVSERVKLDFDISAIQSA